MMATRRSMASLYLLVLLVCCQSITLTNSQNEPLTYQILEELSLGTIVADMVHNPGLDTKYNGSIISQLRFSFLTKPVGLEHLFHIDESSGLIQTIDRIDRDAICSKNEICTLMFDIAVRPPTYFQIIKVKLEVLDINDNAPQFPQGHIVHQISESTLPGKSFSIAAAIDPDSTINSVQNYELVSDSDKFQLRVRETADGAVDLRLVLMEELDRETLDFYEVKIVAHDGGEPPRSGSVLIDVHVLDANDNDPRFENASYEVRVAENKPVGTTVIRVQAIDPDLGDNGQVEYFFSRHTQHTYGDTFGIDRDTGEIFVRGELDFEKADIYLLSITAQDKGPDSLPAQTNVVVRIVDENDNAPQITVNTLTTTGDAHVTENTQPGAFVAHISVEDGDHGDNGVVGCNLDDSNFLLQKLYNTEFKIITATTFDRERHPYFDLRIHCYDRGVNPLSSFAHIRVNVVDENDFSPEFTQQFYAVTVRENNNINDFVVSVTASDKDEGKNGWVKFKLHNDAQNLVAIDEDTGWITANVVFDHENLQELRFHVIASDEGASPRSATSSVLITIMDIDDEKPEFMQNPYTFRIFENQPAGAEVGRVIAVDRDSEPYNYFTYALDPVRTPMGLFDIDPYDGSIRTKQVLDREDQPVYNLVVVARGDHPGKTSTASVSLYIADKNDNAPEFEFPSLSNHTVHISNQAPTGHVIAHLRAHDHDTGSNARLKYSIYEGNEQDFFTMDSSTGAILINRDLTHLRKKDFQLSVRVQDQGEPPYVTHAELDLVVNNALGYQRSVSGISISRDNLIILIIFASATFIISIIIIATIIAIRRRDRTRQDQEASYAKEMEKMLPVEEQNHVTIRKIGAKPGEKKTVGFAQNCIDKSENCHKPPTENDASGHRGPRKVLVPPVPPSRQRHKEGPSPHVIGGHDAHDSDGSGSGQSNSDSGRGPSSEEEDVNHRLSLEALPATEMDPSGFKGRKIPRIHIGGVANQRHPGGRSNPKAAMFSPAKRAVGGPSGLHATTPPPPVRGGTHMPHYAGQSQTLGRMNMGHPSPSKSNSQSQYSTGSLPRSSKHNSQSEVGSPRMEGQSPTAYGQLHPHNLVRDGDSPRGPSPNGLEYHDPRTRSHSPTKGILHNSHMQRPGPQLSPQDSECQRKNQIPDIAKDTGDKDFVVFNCDLVHADRTTDV